MPMIESISSWNYGNYGASALNYLLPQVVLEMSLSTKLPCLNPGVQSSALNYSLPQVILEMSLSQKLSGLIPGVQSSVFN